MAGSGSPRRRMLLGVAKIAALLSIITGICGSLAPVYPRLETFYIYLFGVFALSALLGVFGGALASVVSAILYRSLFGSLQPWMLMGLGVSAAAGSAIKFLRSRSRRAREAPAQIAPDVEPALQPAPAASARDDLQRIESVRQEERDRWSAELARSVDAVNRLRDQLETTRAQAESVQATLKAQIDDLAAKHAAASKRIARADSHLAEVSAELATARTAAETVGRERVAEQAKASEREQTLRRQYEAESEHLQHAASSALEEIQRSRASIDELRSRLDTTSRERNAVRQELDAASSALEEIQRSRALIGELRTRLETSSRERDAVRQELDAASSALEEIQRSRASIDESRTRLESTSRERDAVREELDRERETGRERERELRVQIERLNTDLRTASSQGQALRDEAHTFSVRIEELESALDQDRAVHQERETAWNDQLQKIVNELTSDHENELGDAIEQREQARAEARALGSKVQDLEQSLQQETGTREVHGRQVNDLDAVRAEAGELRSRLQELQEALEQERVSRQERERQLSDGDTARGELQRVVEVERTARRQLDEEWSEKLQKIVSDLASDHENDIGEAMMEREAARAEARHLGIRVQELQQQIEELRSVPLTPTVDERALREQIDGEWSAKLQTIVNHLASDHEEDIGKAMEETQAARAEARTLTTRVANLLQQLERDRQTYASAEEKWNTIRERLLRRIGEFEGGVQTAKLQAVTGPPPEPPPPPAPAAPPPVAVAPPAPAPVPIAAPNDEQRARADVLEIAEQAHAVLTRTAPGSVPMPREERRPLVLFVHHDPNMRTMWRDHLHKNGYDVLTAVDGLEGLRVATAKKPNVVVADAQMPKMDGRELCRMLKSNQETAAIKVVLMSGLYTSEVSLEQLSAEMQPDELLRKPVKFDALQNVLTNLLAVHQP